MTITKYTSFPSLFSFNWMDEMFEAEVPSKYFESPRVTFPYDVVDVEENGVVKATELVFAVGGVPKESISIETNGNTLHIKINKSEKDSGEQARHYRRKGIQRRSMSADYVLNGVDKDNISAELKDGELTITLPREKDSSHKIKIN